MSCIWRANNGNNSDLWDAEWEVWGSCTDFSVEEYFQLATDKFTQFSPNDVMVVTGVAPPTVDRDAFLDQLSAQWGARAWLICDPATRDVNRVSVCLAPQPPYNPIDCPWGITRPSKYDEACYGELNLPTNDAISVPSTCTQYIPRTYETPLGSLANIPPPGILPPPSSEPTPTVAVIAPPPEAAADDPNSSSNAGAIAGGIIGGLAAVALLVGGFLYWRRRKAAANDTLPLKDNPGHTGTTPLNGNSAQPNGVVVGNGDAYDYTTPPKLAWNGGSPQKGYPNGYDGLILAPAGALGSNGTAGTTSPASNGPSTPGSIQVLQRAASPDPLLAYLNSSLSAVSNSSATSRGALAAWELRFDDIKIEYPIGEGSWGRVYKANWNQTQVAVKILMDADGTLSANNKETRSTLLQANSPVMARLKQEASLVKELHHPSIVQFLGITISPASVVTEFCERGSLAGVLQAALNDPQRAAELPWSRRLSLAAGCVKGMLYLHTRAPPIIHRDLKSPNLLVTGAWACKVSDFNLSKLLEETQRATSMAAMNPRWLAPEILRGEPATLAADVFAFGVVLWELMTWQLPWGEENPWAIVGAVTEGQRLSVPPLYELPGPRSAGWRGLSRYIEIMQRCMLHDPAERPTFFEIMAALKEIDPSLE